MKLGKNVYVAAFAAIRADEGDIIIGDCTSIQETCVVHGKGVSIGSNVTVGHGAIVHGCVVEDEVLIGMHATLLCRCRIGAQSIIAAGAVVTEDTIIPQRSVVMGVPAKIVRACTDDDIKRIRASAQSYVDKLKKMKKYKE